jgi:dienelactone hydrolase
VLPMLPSRLLDWVTPAPVVETVTYPSRLGPVQGNVYRPSGPGPFPGMVVCLGVVPFDVDHPQIPRLGEALARSGFAALLYWAPAMRDLRMDPHEVDDFAEACAWFLKQSYVDPARTGLFGTCVGGSFAFMAAADARIRDRIAYVGAFAPYASMWTLARSIATSTRDNDGHLVEWPVDQLTRKVYVRSLTSLLAPDEAAALRARESDPTTGLDESRLSTDGRAIATLLRDLDEESAASALDRLPNTMRARLDALSPMNYLDGIHAPLIVFGHDRDDLVIPAGESRQLRAALGERDGVRYTEFGMFQHADPTKRKLPLLSLARELAKFYRYVFPIFHQATGWDIASEPRR